MSTADRMRATEPALEVTGHGHDNHPLFRLASATVTLALAIDFVTAPIVA
jgi:hypothetical protein